MMLNQLSADARIILRPYITDYEDDVLPSELSFGEQPNEQSVPRIPFLVKSREGFDMPASLYRVQNPMPENPVLIFSHGNAMNQNDSIGFVEASSLLKLGISICVFDFAGCGKGTAPLITMGWREKDELGSVIDYVKSTFGFRKVILWGLSMGAFTTFLTVSERSDIVCAICDSTYDTIGNFLRTFIQSESRYEDARQAVLKHGGFDIDAVDAVAVASRVTIPIVFIHGTNDRTVPSKLSERVFEATASTLKKYLTFRGGHVSPRSLAVENEVIEFIKNVLDL
jgi:pimeloyl-ACP methyl ester carboxylesterase